MNKTFLMMPILYFFMFRSLPAGLPLYYTMSSLIRLIIMVIMHFTIRKPKQKQAYEVKNEKVNNKTSKK